ncbi:MAG: PEP-CTERM sorting domain-containing protein [Pseudomonadota bacterium]|nr:PEP-CTERM sorting domain-containing protein [Pseudomonadota bacterium]
MGSTTNQALASVALPSPGSCTIINIGGDYTSKKGTGYTYDVNKYGGDGCEVMLDIRGELYIGVKDTNLINGWEFGGSYSYSHQVRLESPLPAGTPAPTSVPVKASIRIEGDVTGDGGGYFRMVGSTVNGKGYFHEYPVDAPLSYSATIQTSVAPNTSFTAYVSGTVVLNSGGKGSHTYGQLIVDPFIVVDPASPYASYYGVYQKKKDGTWVELNRNWMQPVPEPETWAMLLAGLGIIGLKACRSRRQCQAGLVEDVGATSSAAAGR